jgi:hypothetical protein
MSFLSRLTCTCTIERNTPAAASTEGHLPSSWAAIASGVWCSLSPIAAAEQKQNTQALLSTHKLFFQQGQDVTEKDRITNIVYQDGTADSAIFNILHVDRPASNLAHLEAFTQRIIP